MRYGDFDFNENVRYPEVCPLYKGLSAIRRFKRERKIEREKEDVRYTEVCPLYRGLNGEEDRIPDF